MRHHLAILYRMYLDEIAAGRKTVECRFGRMGSAPHGLLAAGDLIWFKEVSGPVRVVARARSVRLFSHLTPAVVELIRRDFSGEIRAPAEFWDAGCEATAATLIWLGNVCPLKPFRIEKRDQRAWVVLGGPPIPGRPVVASRAATDAPLRDCRR